MRPLLFLFLSLVAALSMAYICSGCDTIYDTDRGLLWHQQHCIDFLDADSTLNTIPNALQIYNQKKARKKRKLEATAKDHLAKEQVIP